jgi:hypothetical protein
VVHKVGRGFGSSSHRTGVVEKRKCCCSSSELTTRSRWQELYVSCILIMWNHVHTVFTPLLTESSLHEEVNGEGHLIFASDYPGLSAIMHRLKGRSAREANIALSRSGQFWEHESFDHVVRSGKLMDTVRYVLNNPVKAGLVKGWRDWRWSYCRNDLCDKL